MKWLLVSHKKQKDVSHRGFASFSCHALANCGAKGCKAPCCLRQRSLRPFRFLGLLKRREYSSATA